MKRRAFDQWPIANMGLRLAAQVLDQSLILTGTAMGLAYFFPQKISTTEWWLLLFFVWPLLSLSSQSLFIFFTATTPGKKAFGLKISSAKPDSSLSPWQVLSRQCVWWLGALSLGVGWTTVLTRSDRRAWHDLVSETFVAAENKKKSKDASTPVKLWQKTLGHTWAVTVSLLFFSFLSAVIIFEFQKFNQNEGTQIAAVLEATPSLDEASWLLLTDQFDKTAVNYYSFNEEKLGEQIKLFIEAAQVSKARRFDFYKKKMQANEDELCKLNEAKYCYSAQTLSAILSGQETKAANQDGVLPVIKILYKIEKAQIFEDKKQILQAELSHTDPLSTAYMALKTFLIKIHIQKGEFSKAVAFTNKNKQVYTDEIVDNLVAEKYYEYSCQVAAFSQCDNTAYEFCTDNSFWQGWSKGCQNTDQNDLTSNSSKLGYTWKQLLKSKMTSEDWQVQKALFTRPSDFESQIISAIDFTMNLKEESPSQLLEKSKALSLKNPLWGWAQSKAYKEFGSQWLALVNPQEQNQASKYAIENQKTDRAIASVRTTTKKKQEKKKRRRPSMGTKVF